MKKTAKKWISVLLCVTLIAAGSVCAFADTERTEDTAALTDGSYTIGAVTDSTGAGRMFHIAQADNDTCKLEVKDGKMTAIVRLNGQGYDKLYLALRQMRSRRQNPPISFTRRMQTVCIPSVFRLKNSTLSWSWRHTAPRGRHGDITCFYREIPAAPKASFALQFPVPSPSNGTSLRKLNIYGYEAEYALSEDFAGKEQVTVQGAAKTSQKFYLEKGNTYYLRVRSIKTVNDSKSTRHGVIR